VANRDWLIVTVLHAKCDLRKFGFTNREVNTSNSLPNCVVSANTNMFKTRLDRPKLWHNQELEVVASFIMKNLSKE